MNEDINVLINEDVYIQKGPKKISFDEVGNENIEYVNRTYYFPTFRYLYCIDDSGVDYFYQISKVDENNFKLYRYNNDGINEYGDISLEEFNNGFVKLSDFLSGAVFVGLEFERIAPVTRYSYYNGTCIDKRDMNYVDGFNDNEKNIVLYIKGNIFLIKHISDSTSEYRIVGCRYTEDGKYNFLGPVYEEYSDRKKIYIEILEQLNNSRIEKKIRTKKKI